jgi:hypothetical protein
LYGISIFGLFFTSGILARKNAAVHKRLLFFATLVLMQAAIDRTRFLPGMGTSVYIAFAYLDSLLILVRESNLLTHAIFVAENSLHRKH